MYSEFLNTDYDYNTPGLTEGDIIEIKSLVKKIRFNYSAAPIGKKIFDLISSYNNKISFMLEDFVSEKIDGILFIPDLNDADAYIIINSIKPLANQIFTAAHEFYHYIADFEQFKKRPYICDFSNLNSINEQKASRFAAELLLPQDALLFEINALYKALHIKEINIINSKQLAVISVFLCVKYEMPLKAVLYRFYEERIIEDISFIEENYDFIKYVLNGIQLYKKEIDELCSSNNHYIYSSNHIYSEMEVAYQNGYATKEEILEDSKILNLDSDIVNSFLTEFEEDKDDSDKEKILFDRLKFEKL
ncbi:MAG: ImmA/IrrE family metallo-endopeptidase [Erysipelotrichaceae bacterium]